MSDRQGPSPSRWRPFRGRSAWLVGGILVVIAGVVVVLVTVASGGTDTSDEEAQSRNTAEVTRTDLTDETTYEGTLGRPEAEELTAGSEGVVTSVPDAGTIIESGDTLFAVDERPVVLLEGAEPAYRDLQLGDTLLTLSANGAGVVTWLPEAGDLLENGSVLVRIDDRPVVVLAGEVPMYRTLKDGVEGEDVQQLEQDLVDLGYDPDGTVTVDQEYTGYTESMVERWQEDIGVDETGRVNTGDVVFAPVPGQVVARETTVGSSVNQSTPVLQLGGGDPLSGPDVMQLEEALAALGYDPGAVDGVYDLATARAVIDWTGAVGHGQDGRLPSGSVVFNPGSLRIADVLADVGTSVGPATPVVGVADLETIVSMDLPASDQELLTVGSPVTVVLPDRSETPGTVSSVASVATSASEPGGQATFPVEITLDDPSAAEGLDEAPVDVKAVTDEVQDVLAVPVSALVALAEGGYAVELVEGNQTRLVAVEPGFFAEGLVEVTGDVAEGDIVVVP